eukprot:2077032-Pyramimonas_sp.AAC.1
MIIVVGSGPIGSLPCRRCWLPPPAATSLPIWTLSSPSALAPAPGRGQQGVNRGSPTIQMVRSKSKRMLGGEAGRILQWTLTAY